MKLKFLFVKIILAMLMILFNMTRYFFDPNLKKTNFHYKNAVVDAVKRSDQNLKKIRTGPSIF